LLFRSVAEPGLEDCILAEQQGGIKRVGTFGAPTIAIHRRHGCGDPVMPAVPTGEDAGMLWDHLAWLAAREDVLAYQWSR
jgi:hypothetical protein